MKSKFFMLLALAMMTLTLAFVASAADQKKKGNETQPPVMQPANPTVMKVVNLTCKNPGSHQDVSKNPDIINSTRASIPAGTKISWKATDGDKGTITLSQALAPGAKVGVMGTPGNGYSCTAWYTPK